MRAIVEKAASERHGHILAPAVEDAALRIWELPLVEQFLREFIAVVVLIAADLALDPEAIELRVEDEVDDTGDRVGAVDGGRAAGQHFDALDDRRRDTVDVGDGEARIARHEAMAVDQDKRPDGAEAAKVDRSGTCRAGGNELALRRIDLGKLVEELFGVGGALQLEFFALDHRDRADGRQVRARNA